MKSPWFDGGPVSVYKRTAQVFRLRRIRARCGSLDAQPPGQSAGPTVRVKPAFIRSKNLVITYMIVIDGTTIATRLWQELIVRLPRAINGSDARRLSRAVADQIGYRWGQCGTT